MVPISLKMPEALVDEVTEEAQRRGVSRSALIREAVTEHLNGRTALGEHNVRPRPGSALSLVAHLVGRWDGPPDLSTNPKYMEGFGE